MQEEQETIKWMSSRKYKTCKKTGGGHEIEKFRPWNITPDIRDAVCGCGKKLWFEVLCTGCERWVSDHKSDHKQGCDKKSIY